MMYLKPLNTLCVLAASALLGCTHSADLQRPTAPQRNATLQSHHWQLQQAQTAQGQPDAQWQLPAANGQPARVVGLRFGDNQALSVDRLCNAINGSYRSEGAQLQVSRLATTMMACSDAALMKLERDVAQQLPQVRTWKITDDTPPLLQLAFENGSTWQLTGTATHETLYGPSARIFLEVAAQKVACNHPLMPNAQCLQVREIAYNEGGIKQSTGTWAPYYGTIENYTHSTNMRHILRIKRFTHTPTPADGSQYVDVLDMVVESEVVR